MRAMMRVRRGFPRLSLATALLLTLAGCWGDGSGSVDSGPGDSTVQPTTPTVRSGADVRYVSPEGRNSGPGTKGDPWRTLKHALPQMLPGEVLYVRGGDYYERLSSLALHPGAAGEEILVQAYPGERPVVHGSVALRRPSYWLIDGLNVTWDDAMVNPPPHMVKVVGGVGWSWMNSEIWGAVGVSNVFVAGLDEGDPADWSFVGNCVHGLTVAPGANRGSNMTVGDMDDGGPGIIERNLFFNVQSGRNLTLGSVLGGRATGPNDVLVRFNTLYDSSSAIRLAGDTSDVRIERNIIGDASSGIMLRASQLMGSGVKVQQNLGVGAQQFFHDAHTGELSRNRAGNNLVNSVTFDDETSCSGFNSEDSVTLPYGKDAIG